MLQFIYAIIDELEQDLPPEATTAYIGITIDPNTRMQQHLQEHSDQTEKNTWIQEKRASLKMIILEIVDDSREEGLKREEHWRQEYRRRGVGLVNIQMNPRPKRRRAVQQLTSYRAHINQFLQSLQASSPVADVPESAELERDWEAFLEEDIDEQDERTQTSLETFLWYFYAGGLLERPDQEKHAVLEDWHAYMQKRIAQYESVA